MDNASSTRFQNKKSNIKDILVRNFFRKYPLTATTDDLQQLQIERDVAQEFDRFVATTKEISTRNLTDFEHQLARQHNLTRKEGGSNAAVGNRLVSPIPPSGNKI